MLVCVHLYTISPKLDVLVFFLLMSISKTNMGMTGFDDMGMEGFVTVPDAGKSEQELKTRTWSQEQM